MYIRSYMCYQKQNVLPEARKEAVILEMDFIQKLFFP